MELNSKVCEVYHLGKIICVFRHPKMVVTNFDRPNLYFSVRMKDPDRNIINDLENLMVKDGSVRKFPGPTIIYCPTKKATEKVAEALSGKLDHTPVCNGRNNNNVMSTNMQLRSVVLVGSAMFLLIPIAPGTKQLHVIDSMLVKSEPIWFA